MEVTLQRVALLVVALLVPGLAQAAPALADPDDPAQPGPFAVTQLERTLSRPLVDGGDGETSVTIWYPADGAGPFPLVVFSHGLDATPAADSLLLQHLASHGYVVAAPQHDDCPTGCTPGVIASAVDQRRIDVVSTMQSMQNWSDAGDRLPGGLVDGSRIGLAGWSFGGATTLRVMETEPTVQAALVLAPATMFRPSPEAARVARPVMIVAGRLDTTVPYAETRRFYRAIPADAPARWFLAVADAGHSFGDNCLENTPVAQFATLPCSELVSQTHVNQILARWGTPFLDRYVAGRSESAALLDPATNADTAVSVSMSDTGSPSSPPADDDATP
jgi:predicted dienelactone hydrolase